MISLITGLPGHGKTLYALNYIKALAEKEKREVFYSGIKDLMLPWTEFQPEQWMSLPAGSIIVIDEAQFVFARKPNGSKLPPHYEQLAVHRHSGYDIFLITQHPTLLDNFVRQLVEKHLHIIRKFGLHRANVWQYQSACSTPQNASSQKGAILHKFAYPKEVYGYYKSAEIHTVKRSIPMKVVLAVIFVIAAPLYAYWSFNKPKPQPEQAQLPQQSAPAAAGQSVVNGGKVSYTNALEDAKQYVFERTPRLENMQHTAPRYDELTKPTSVPVPAACVQMAGRCSCFTQQGTPYVIDEGTCREIVQKGYYVDFRPDQEQQMSMQGAQPYLVRGDALRVPVDPQKPDDLRSAAVMLASDLTSAGRMPEGVEVPQQFAKGMLH